MAQVDRTVRGSRAIVVLAVVLIFAGSCGVANAVTGLSTDQSVPAAPVDSTTAPELEEAATAVRRELARVALEAPARRPLQAANLVVSLMLVTGGMMLFGRRRSAPWWITQAALANILWTLAVRASYHYQLQESSAVLTEVFARQRQAMQADPATPSWMLSTTGLLPHIVMSLVLSTLIPLALWAWVIWRVRRPDVRAVLDGAAG